MTRLIDADKLEAYGTTVPKECNAEDYLSGARDVLEHIDSMPTVDAIPVEWLNQYSVAVNHDSIKDITRANVVNELIDTYLAERDTRKGYCLSKQSVQNDTNGRLVNEKKGNKSICESCGNISCIYQSGIYREKCDFYMGCTFPMCDMTCPVHQQQIKDKLESIGIGIKRKEE